MNTYQKTARGKVQRHANGQDKRCGHLPLASEKRVLLLRTWLRIIHSRLTENSIFSEHSFRLGFGNVSQNSSIRSSLPVRGI